MAVKIRTQYYEQFDADPAREVPAEGYGGWKSAELEIEPRHTALVVMHAWETGTREMYPGWYRYVEYIPRAQQIGRTVFPRLLSAVRASELKLFHVVGGGDYYKGYAGYKRAVELAGPPPEPPTAAKRDPVFEQLRQFKEDLNKHNAPDIERGFKNLTFQAEAVPAGDEGIAENAHQLFALCRAHDINHLVYVGFAINWCLLLSPGGMADMGKHGIICSTIRQATTAVENKESARHELCKALALWRIAIAFGYVYDLEDFLRGISPAAGPRGG